MEHISSICLKDERKRLKYTQQALADAVSVSDMSIKRWETGTPIPSDKLSLMGKLGFDIQYILTGVPASEHTKQSIAAMLNSSDITDDTIRTELYDAVIKDTHARAVVSTQRKQLYADLLDTMNTFDDELMERIRLTVRDAYLAQIHENKK
ncbi:helix-turn-helix domain-containing protein [Acinetobacter sp. B10A]|uniref:helix-turn-helix transcriptional regulator n=1 Tax=Acinetobacter baretiae TaxID=2605383 RepID=UPI001B3C7EBB|nr:helix-turn-helix transcriptional regulator [Acinetobacter baretiae]MBF7686452.1 helix-turn-helix domain-containing protein [Acinetobacter baretiae]